MTYYSNWGWYRFTRPQDLLENEWTLFGIVFMASFALVYLALSNFFNGKKNLTPFERMMGVSADKSGAKGPITIISVCVAALISFSLTRNNYLQAYLGAGAALGILVFSIIVFAILTLPFYVALEKNFSAKIAGPLFGLIIWIVLKFLFPSMMDDMIWRMPYEWQDFYQIVISGFGLVILMVIGFIIGVMRKK
jgi:hypothetical protein